MYAKMIPRDVRISSTFIYGHGKYYRVVYLLLHKIYRQSLKKITYKAIAEVNIQQDLAALRKKAKIKANFGPKFKAINVIL